MERQEHENAWQQRDDSATVPYHRMMDGLSSDSDDIFNEKVTDKIDEINQSQLQKYSALDALTSPQTYNIANAQLTGST